jgi:predicted 2-oxoglutarate/Fe(II)-dependent dioxygenase YbiX
MTVLFAGDPAPMFKAPTPSNPAFIFGTVAGRYIALCFLPKSGASPYQAVRAEIARHRDVFNDRFACLFFVARSDADRQAVEQEAPGIRVFYDENDDIARLYGITPSSDSDSGWIVIDPGLHILFTAPLTATPALLRRMRELPDPDQHAGVALSAPVLILPRLFEPRLCEALIKHYREMGGKPSGFMREVNGVTRLLEDPSHKRRNDAVITDLTLIRATRERIVRRLIPEVKKAFDFAITRMERYIVCRYSEEEKGFFNVHRDNTTPGTAHRRFACTINLNTGDYDGGSLRFPEFGSRLYDAPRGGAVVFSCSLLHEATPVTKGERFAFLPFFYDDAAAKIREANLQYVEPELANYKADRLS